MSDEVRLRDVQQADLEVYADPFVGYTGSVRLLERFGFKPTGTVWYGENEHVLLVLDLVLDAD
jgi:RimJ/RimL family protein N-acetyltransferase